MSAVERLAQLRAGQRPRSGLLHSCRLHAFGSEVYGEEAIIERFRTMPDAIGDGNAVIVRTRTHVAMFAGAEAIIADVADENIARVWRLGSGAPLLPEPGVSVVFDPDLRQDRGDLLFVASDHPALVPEAVPIVTGIGRDLASGDASLRARAFAIRAFGTAHEGAALFALYCLSGSARRSSGFVHVAAHWSDGTVALVRDSAGAEAVSRTAWTPHIGD